jgi:hypothetical protein
VKEDSMTADVEREERRVLVAILAEAEAKQVWNGQLPAKWRHEVDKEQGADKYGEAVMTVVCAPTGNLWAWEWTRGGWQFDNDYSGAEPFRVEAREVTVTRYVKVDG